MGASLYIGFIAKATTDIPSNLSKNELIDQLEKYYPKEIFDCQESSDRKLIWALKQEVLKSELVEFVKQFYKHYFGDSEKPWMKGKFKEIPDLIASSNWLKKPNYNDDYEENPCFHIDHNYRSERFSHW